MFMWQNHLEGGSIGSGTSQLLDLGLINYSLRFISTASKSLLGRGENKYRVVQIKAFSVIVIICQHDRGTWLQVIIMPRLYDYVFYPQQSQAEPLSSEAPVKTRSDQQCEALHPPPRHSPGLEKVLHAWCNTCPLPSPHAQAFTSPPVPIICVDTDSPGR